MKVVRGQNVRDLVSLLRLVVSARRYFYSSRRFLSWTRRNASSLRRFTASTRHFLSSAICIVCSIRQEKMRGQRGSFRALAGICHVHESYF